MSALDGSRSWSSLVRAGALVADALTATYGRGKTVEVVWELLEDLEAAPDVVALLQPSAEGTTNAKEPVLLPPDQLRIGVLGAIFDKVARWLPQSAYDLPKALADVKIDTLVKELFSDLRSGLEDLG